MKNFLFLTFEDESYELILVFPLFQTTDVQENQDCQKAFLRACQLMLEREEGWNFLWRINKGCQQKCSAYKKIPESNVASEMLNCICNAMKFRMNNKVSQNSSQA